MNTVDKANENNSEAIQGYGEMREGLKEERSLKKALQNARERKKRRGVASQKIARKMQKDKNETNYKTKQKKTDNAFEELWR